MIVVLSCGVRVPYGDSAASETILDRAARHSGRALMAEQRAVVVVSGGLDSTTMAYSLRARGYELVAISFDYGQRHRKELEFAEQMAADLHAPWTLIDLHAAGVT